ncbi:uncharacterized protein LOC107430965 [Ziziphus jujuba]|uniref:Uncharacterized protein LOC107430965 n=2 Tax=Ziziphus jujuba TaxID=326968 RepID=A0A6P4AII2_ZIZJJ|nr:uncharacterized protein LOC107430965 [Ziziphus jujuba]KAH7514778.1 hypothetical protein FEM48_Zijuj11G0126500 [Ziziphus jujuba var. spinosa]
MQTAQSSVAGVHKVRRKSGRKPLQPKNIPANPIVHDLSKITNPKKERIDVSLICCGDGESNKENHPVYATPTKKMETLDSSLAEELSAIRKKLERQREDRERTEKMLKERDLIMEMQMKELEFRGEIQRKLEIEVDRLYRLKQLHSQSIGFSLLRSLREKEGEKKGGHEGQFHELGNGDGEESVGENVSQESTSLASPEISTEM